MKRNLVVLASLLIALLLVQPGVAQNTATATAAAAVDGSFGLEVVLDGSTNGAFVQSNHPSSETTYRASFWLKRPTLANGGLFMENCSGACSTRFVAALIRGANPGAGPPNVTVGRLIARRLAVNGAGSQPRYSFVFAVRNNFGGFVQVGSTLLTDNVVRKFVTLEWQAGGPANANDGVARIYTSNDGSLGNLQGERTTVVSGDMVVDFLQLGAPAGLSDQPDDPSNSGSLYFDTFSSFRTLAP